MIYAAIVVGAWFLTILTYILGYNHGRIAGQNEVRKQREET